MNVKELVKMVKDSTPALAGMPDGRAAALIRAAFGEISAQLAATEEGVVKVGGLGNFRVRQVEREKGGQKERVKVVTFVKPAPAGKGKAEGEAGA